MDDLVERLHAKVDRGYFTRATITADGKLINRDQVLIRVNPDGPEAADRIEKLEAETGLHRIDERQAGIVLNFGDVVDLAA